jgi:hypothetical protein
MRAWWRCRMPGLVATTPASSGLALGEHDRGRCARRCGRPEGKALMGIVLHDEVVDVARHGPSAAARGALPARNVVGDLGIVEVRGISGHLRA